MKNRKATIRAVFGSNAGSAGAHNRRVIIDAIRVNKALSRAELARATKLTKQTVSNIIDELEQDGLVMPLKTIREGRGKPATPYTLASNGAFAIGLQIDRDVARLIVVNLTGDIMIRHSVKLDSVNPEEGFETLVDLINAARAELEQMYCGASGRTAGLGVAMPGPFGKLAAMANGANDDAYSMAVWQRFPLVERLKERTGLDVSLQNDAAAATIAEKLMGNADSFRNVVCFYFGFGLGAGLIINGELYTGVDGNAGEIGLLKPVISSAETESLEHMASLASLCHAMGWNPSDDDLFSHITTALEEKNFVMERWLEQAASHLRWAAQGMHLMFAPEATILCATAPKPLIDRLVCMINEDMGRMANPSGTPFMMVGTADQWAVAIGAASEPISNSFSPRHSALIKS
nr:ROK family transcriptional regulator [uncultured Cohaesibacter sp.]